MLQIFETTVTLRKGTYRNLAQTREIGIRRRINPFNEFDFAKRMQRIGKNVGIDCKESYE